MKAAHGYYPFHDQRRLQNAAGNHPFCFSSHVDGRSHIPISDESNELQKKHKPRANDESLAREEGFGPYLTVNFKL
jgi:hypothetical protein